MSNKHLKPVVLAASALVLGSSVLASSAFAMSSLAQGYMASAGANLASTADDVNVLTANINQTIVWDPLYTGSAQRPNDTQSYINSNHATRYVNAATMRQLIAGMRSRSPGTFFGGYGGVSGVPSSWMAPSFAAAANVPVPMRVRPAPLFDAPIGRHDWLSRTIIVGHAQRHSDPDHTLFTYYEVL